MVTTIGQRGRAHLYIKEWMDHREMSDERVASRLGVARETVWKWRTQPTRLNPGKLQALAAVLGIEPPDFYRPPSRPSLDAMVAEAPDDVQAMAVDIVRRLVRRGS